MKNDIVLKAPDKRKKYYIDSTITKRAEQYNLDGKFVDVYTFVMSSEIIDRSGEVVLIDGLDTTKFELNPVMFYMHNSMEEPIGRWLSITKTDNQLIGTCYFNCLTEESCLVKSLVDCGDIKATSIGFRGKKGSFKDYNGQPNVWIWELTELVECSIVNIGCNQDSLRIKELNDLILKSGRTISSANEKALKAIHADLTKCHQTMTNWFKEVGMPMEEPEDPEDMPPEEMPMKFQELFNQKEAEILELNNQISDLKAENKALSATVRTYTLFGN